MSSTTVALLAGLVDGATPDRGRIPDFIDALVAGDVDAEQVGAFLMAVRVLGLEREATVELTDAMARSGEVLSWQHLDGPVVDKHSTGGVGDPVSLVLAPAVAACGVYVPMISGRGLGHTGGTLDKLEAVPGVSTRVELEAFRRMVSEVGFAIVSASPRLAPADARLYAARDVTATVKSVPLITASILSKKIAAGIGRLVLDVKYGNGAFAADLTEARTLADSLTEVGGLLGMEVSAVMNPMSEPLAPVAGNALEIAFVVEQLTGAGSEPFRSTVIDLGSRMLRLAGVETCDERAGARIEQAIDSGRAAERFVSMLRALGADIDNLTDIVGVLPRAPVREVLTAESDCVVEGVDTRGLGMAVVELGGGRRRSGESIDPSVGLSDLARIGQRLRRGDSLATVHASTEERARSVAGLVRACYSLRTA